MRTKHKIVTTSCRKKKKKLFQLKTDFSLDLNFVGFPICRVRFEIFDFEMSKMISSKARFCSFALVVVSSLGVEQSLGSGSKALAQKSGSY